jgi:uncharacterized protein YukE
MSSPAVGRVAVPGARTDFSHFNQAQLAQMLYTSDPEAVTATGDTWSDVGRLLYSQASDIERQLAEFRPMWSGQAADRYVHMMTNLVEGIRQIATVAFGLRDQVYSAGEALRRARAQFPPPVPVPSLDAQTVAAATATLPSDPGIPAATMAMLRGQQAQAVTAVRQYQQAQAQAAAALQAAVRVMTELAERYTGVREGFPAVPNAAALPVLNKNPDGSTSLVTTPVGLTRNPPLFSGVFGNGLSAAHAALGAGFAAALPALIATGTGKNNGSGTNPGTGSNPGTGTDPGNGNGSGPGTGTDPGTIGDPGYDGDLGGIGNGGRPPDLGDGGLGPGGLPGGTGDGMLPGGVDPAGVGGKLGGAQFANASLPSGSMGGIDPAPLGAGGGGAGGAGSLGSFAGGGGGGGGVGSIGGMDAAAAANPVAHAGLAGTTAAGTVAGAGLAAGAIAKANGGNGSFMPMMPMGGAGAGDGGGAGRRIPSWLCETDDLWGVSSAVVAPVIGDPDPPPQNAWPYP